LVWVFSSDTAPRSGGGIYLSWTPRARIRSLYPDPRTKIPSLSSWSSWNQDGPPLSPTKNGPPLPRGPKFCFCSCFGLGWMSYLHRGRRGLRGRRVPASGSGSLPELLDGNDPLPAEGARHRTVVRQRLGLPPILEATDAALVLAVEDAGVQLGERIETDPTGFGQGETVVRGWESADGLAERSGGSSLSPILGQRSRRKLTPSSGLFNIHKDLVDVEGEPFQGPALRGVHFGLGLCGVQLGWRPDPRRKRPINFSRLPLLTERESAVSPPGSRGQAPERAGSREGRLPRGQAPERAGSREGRLPFCGDGVGGRGQAPVLWATLPRKKAVQFSKGTSAEPFFSTGP